MSEVFAAPKTLLELIDWRITDVRYTAANPIYTDAHRMAARARIDELEWVKRCMEASDSKYPELRFEIVGNKYGG